ncbi:MAG: type II secretion system protein F [Gammaproteobacteria bacterium]|nr:type II secretion system protein F [Gammaproteobacteria bacterium]
MPAYSYSAFNGKGKKQKGYLSANSEREARKLIKALNLTPIKIEESTKNIRSKARIRTKALVLATRQMSTLLDSDIALDEAIKVVANHLNDKELANVFYSIREEVMQGKRLGEAMMNYPNIFSNTYTSLVTAGDTSGKLSFMFNNLANYLEEAEQIKQKIVSAMTYPAILIIFSIGVITALLTFVMPQVVNQFIRAGVELPLLTQVLLSLSNNMPWLIIVLVALVFLLSFFYQKIRSDKAKLIILHKRWLSLPIIGDFILKADLERFSSTMYLLLNSGITLDIAMKESSKVINNLFLREVISKANKEISEGKDFIVSLEDTMIFPDIFMQLISSGYIAGNLTLMFEKVSEFMKSEIEARRSMVLSLMEPIVIIIMGGFILLIVLAILIPIMQMNAVSIG